MITLMTPDAPPVSSELADLSRVRLGEMPGVATVTLDQAVQRVLPGVAPAAAGGALFNSSV